MRAFMRGAVIASTVLIGTTSAHAFGKVWPKWYVGLSGYYNILQDIDADATTDFDIEMDQGFGTSIALGYMIGAPRAPGRWRVELEGAWRANDIDKIGGATADEDIRALSAMLNGYYDFETQTSLRPYLGLGIGVSSMTFDYGTDSDDDTVLSYQAMLGLTYTPASLHHTELFAGYRFFRSEDADFGYTTGNIKTDGYNSHNVEVGARLRF